MEKRGFLICVEGIDASGKTTQAHTLVKNLKDRGFDAIYTTEPSYGAIGRFIRRHVLQGEKRIQIILEALLFAADRVDHVEKEIKPAFKQGRIVVSDRCLYSSIAYQGAAGLDLQWIEEINKWTARPDLAIFIDVPPEVVIKRMKWRRKSVMETLENQQRVREVYMKLVQREQLMRINGNRPKMEVSNDILSIVLEFLRKT